MAQRVDQKKKNENISDVFRDTGQPTITYVERDNGKFERDLQQALESGGQMALITGPSKTGKTTLYKQVLAEMRSTPLVVRCDDALAPEDFWRRALEQAGATRLVETSQGSSQDTRVSAEVGGKGGWKFIGELFAKAGLEIGSSTSESEIRNKILARPSPLHLIPILKNSNFVLVIEDFHYLRDEVKSVVFKQWKNFVDDEITIVVIGTTHHAIDIAYANKDLLGRINQIDVGQWGRGDLVKIIEKGLDYLQVPSAKRVREFIANESVGLPIITQQVGLQIFADHGITKINGARTIGRVLEKHAAEALNNVAQSRYRQLEYHYNIITTGPKKRARKYETYELLLSCFTLDPISFSLSRVDIDSRLRELPNLSGELSIFNSLEIPPAASINSMLGALNRFQKRHHIEILEWRPIEKRVYMLEPAFLFFLRWRVIRTGSVASTAFEKLLHIVRRSQLEKSNTLQLWLDLNTDDRSNPAL
jgi:hypothetical protein